MVMSESIRLMADDSGAALRVMRPQGEVVFSSDGYASLGLLPRSIKPVATVFDEFPRPAAEERLRLYSEVIQNGHAVRMVELLHGRLCVSTHRRLELADAMPCVLVGFVPVQDRDHYQRVMSDAEHRRAVFNTGGALSGLGIRQIEVLRLIGLGFNGQEIAQELHRSPRTIEFHRKAIRDRLGEMTLVELAQLACRSGIVHMPQSDLENWWSKHNRPMDTGPAGRIHDLPPPG